MFTEAEVAIPGGLPVGSEITADGAITLPEGYDIVVNSENDVVSVTVVLANKDNVKGGGGSSSSGGCDAGAGIFGAFGALMLIASLWAARGFGKGNGVRDL